MNSRSPLRTAHTADRRAQVGALEGSFISDLCLISAMELERIPSTLKSSEGRLRPSQYSLSESIRSMRPYWG
jgi:hypothetical protein